MNAIEELKRTIANFGMEIQDVERSLASASAELKRLNSLAVSSEEFKQAVLDRVDAKSMQYQARLSGVIYAMQYQKKWDRQSGEHIAAPVSFDRLDFMTSPGNTNSIGLFESLGNNGKTDENALCFFFGDLIKEKLSSTLNTMESAWPEGTETGSDRAARREEIVQLNQAIATLKAQKDALESERFKIISELRNIGGRA